MSYFLAGIAAVIFTLSPIGSAAAAPQAQPRSIGVSVPVSPVSLAPGETSQIPIRVTNPGSAPVAVTVKGTGIKLGNNGRVNFTGAPDAQWSSRTDFPPGELTVPAQNYIDVAITVHMPPQIYPDFYFIGFLVTPVATGAGVVQINQIGSFLTINVPGPRVKKISAVLQALSGGIHVGNVEIGSNAAGTVTVRNIGKSSVQFWGENDTSSWFGGAESTQQRINISLLPVGDYRSFVMTSKPRFPIDVVTMKVTVTYSGTNETSTKQIVVSKRFLVINPWAIVAVCVLVILVLSWWMRRRLRRSSKAAGSNATKPTTSTRRQRRGKADTRDRDIARLKHKLARLTGELDKPK